MKYLPKGWDTPKSILRIIFWGVPCLFTGPNPYHGYHPIEMYFVIPGLWVLGAFIGLIRNPEKEAKLFYACWLIGIFALAWWHYVLPNYA